jgi:hypothetical protein
VLKILGGESTIRRCQRQLIRALRPFVTDRIAVKIGHPGESFRAKILWAGVHGIWFHTRTVAGDRYRNAFGLGRPPDGGAVSSTIEINVPTGSLDRKIGGAFAMDDAGRVFLIHRGKIGGRRGVGKSLFEAHYRGVWSEVEDGDTLSAVVVIGELQSPLFIRQLAQFVRKVDAIKDLGADDDPQARIFFDDERFREEFIGGRYVPERRDYAAECDRDLAVLDLAHRLKETGARVGSGPGGEIFTRDAAGQASSVFEVVTGAAPACLEQGVARLLLRSVRLPREPRRVLVVAKKPGGGLGELLVKLGIHVVAYSWVNGTAVFASLEEGDRGQGSQLRDSDP